MSTGIGEALARPDLLLNLVWAELTARYKTTALGVLWFVVNPMVMMGILVMIFGQVVHLDIPNYPAFVLSALLPWNFFSMAINNAASSLSRASGLVKRVRIPREFVPLSALLASLVHFLISLIMLFALMWYLRVRVSPFVMFLPIIIGLHLVFLVGACLLVASPQCFVSRHRTHSLARPAGLVLLHPDLLPAVLRSEPMVAMVPAQSDGRHYRAVSQCPGRRMARLEAGFADGDCHLSRDAGGGSHFVPASGASFR